MRAAKIKTVYQIQFDTPLIIILYSGKTVKSYS